MSRKADRILRGAGNKAGRNRMTSNSSLRREYFTRGVIVSSGETLPDGQSSESLRARMFIIEFARGDISLEILTRLQSYAAEGRFASTMAGYIQWLFGKIETLASELEARHIELTRQFSREDWHSRTPSNLALLTIGLEMALAYFKEAGGISDDDYFVYLNDGKRTLFSAAGEHQYFIDEARPEKRFPSLLRQLFASGKAHIAGFDQCIPATNPEIWGWKLVDGHFKAQGKKIGWLDGCELYLEPDSTYVLLRQLAEIEDISIASSRRKLWKNLYRCGFLASKNASRETYKVRKTIGKNRINVIHVKAALIHPGTNDVIV